MNPLAERTCFAQVPNQEPAAIRQLVIEHCEAVFAKLGSANSVRVWSEHGAKAFGGDPLDANYQAARRANKTVYGVDPDFSRSGGSIPVTLTMQETGRSVVLFPVGRCEPETHRVGPEFGSTLRALIGIFSQTGGSTCECWVNPVSFTLCVQCRAEQ